MGILIDHNHRYTDDEKNYLESRGRGYLIPANERRFGTNENPREPEAHEQHDSEAISPFYQAEDRHAAVYDVGGAPLPGTVLNYETGRVYDRNNGVEVEFTGPGHTPGASTLATQRDASGFHSYEVDEHGNRVESIDDDIVELVLNLPNVKAIKDKLDVLGVEYEKGAKREDLENALAIALQDDRDGDLNLPPEAEK
jgi:hypothetical protein